MPESMNGDRFSLVDKALRIARLGTGHITLKVVKHRRSMQGITGMTTLEGIAAK